MIHKYRMYGTNLVLDVNSGAVHVFDDLSYEILDYYNKADIEEIKDKFSAKYNNVDIVEALEEIRELENSGELFSEDIYKDYLPVWDKKPVIKAMCLHISHDCNLRCRYCFASTGDFGRQRSMMSSQVGIKAIDLLIEKSGNRKNLEIDFFGGEPLMNFDTVKDIVIYALGREKEANKKFRFTLTTNALLLNEENKKFINEHMNNIVLSIDGRKETNDRMRFRIDGTGIYDSILPKIMDLVESRNQDKYYVRGTFTRENIDFSKDILHLAQTGFKQISVEPVVAEAGSGYDIREEDIEAICNEYEKFAREYVEIRKGDGWFNFFHFMVDLGQGPCVAKRLNGCGSGHEYIAITPEGDIYPCHQFVGMDEYRMGNVSDGIIDTKIQDVFKKSNIYTKDECSNCWAKFYCSGGCAANAYSFNGDINKPYKIGCELEKKRVECALWIKTLEG